MLLKGVALFQLLSLTFALAGTKVRSFYRITVHCVYYLSGLQRLFQFHKFISDYPGFGSVQHIKLTGMCQLIQRSSIAPSWPMFTLHCFSAIGQRVANASVDITTTAPQLTVSSAGEISNVRPIKYSKVKLLKDLTKVGVLHPLACITKAHLVFQ